MSEFKISIVIPCYKTDGSLIRCIDSCLANDFKNIEIVLVDDGENVGLKSIPCKYKDKSIVVVDNGRNLGTFLARKNGFLKSTGDYILYVDPDDALKKNAIDRVVTHINNVESELIFFKVDRVLGDKKFIFYDVPKDSFYPESLKYALIDIKNPPKASWGKVYKRCVLEKAFNLCYFLNERYVYTEDSLLFYCSLISAKNISAIKCSLYNYHCNKNSITMTCSNESLEYKISQMFKTIYFIDRVSEDFSDDLIKEAAGRIKGILLNEIFHLRKKISCSRYFVNYFKNQLVVIVLTEYKIKNLFKMIIFLISFGIIKL